MEGVSELYTYNKRIERINLIKHGGTPKTNLKSKQNILFEEAWSFYC
jgi:hypothetical protein